MIFLNSRYAENPVVSLTHYQATTETIGGKTVPITTPDKVTVATVFRSPPVKTSGRSTKYYMWKDGDRIDSVSERTLSDASMWWKIMDLNPEILDPIFIEPGTLIRIPSVTA